MTSKQCLQCTSFVFWINATVDRFNSECCLQCVQRDLVLLSCVCSGMALFGCIGLMSFPSQDMTIMAIT